MSRDNAVCIWITCNCWGEMLLWRSEEEMVCDCSKTIWGEGSVAFCAIKGSWASWSTIMHSGDSATSKQEVQKNKWNYYRSIFPFVLNTLHVAINVTVFYPKFSKFHNFLNQYQACFYLFECISHGDSRNSYQIPQCWHFWTFCDISYCRLLTPAAWKGLSLARSRVERVRILLQIAILNIFAAVHRFKVRSSPSQDLTWPMQASWNKMVKTVFGQKSYWSPPLQIQRNYWRTFRRMLKYRSVKRQSLTTVLYSC